jgi:predicted permease
VLLTFVIAFAFGVVPAFAATRVSLATALREEAGAATPSFGRRRLQMLFVAVQTGLAAILLIVAALFFRSVTEGSQIDPGFDGGRQLLASIDLFPNGYSSERGIAFYDAAAARLGALPGVESVAFARRLALDLGGTSSTYLEITGYTPGPNEEILVSYNAVSPGYLHTLGGRLLAGREFVAADRADAPPAAMVSQAMARRYWPHGDALGSHFRMFGREWTVVGISADMAYKDDDLGATPRPFFFVPLAQEFRPQVTIHIRTVGDPLALAPAVRNVVAELDPDLPLYAIKSLDEHLGIALFKPRLAATLLGAFGSVSLLLAAVGLFGLTSLAARQRRRELALRSALGAAPRDLANLLIGQGARAAAIGLTGGVLAAGALASISLRSLLVGVKPLDPLPWLVAVSALAAATIGASWWPARRAARLDLASALREE